MPLKVGWSFCIPCSQSTALLTFNLNLLDVSLFSLDGSLSHICMKETNVNLAAHFHSNIVETLCNRSFLKNMCNFVFQIFLFPHICCAALCKAPLSTRSPCNEVTVNPLPYPSHPTNCDIVLILPPKMSSNLFPTLHYNHLISNSSRLSFSLAQNDEIANYPNPSLSMCLLPPSHQPVHPPSCSQSDLS